MFRRIFLCLAPALAALLAGFLAGPAYAENIVFPPGSHIGLIPPAGFEPVAALRGNPNVHGFEDRTNEIAIAMLELPPQVYSDLAKATTAESLKKQGLTLDKREELSLKDGQAILFIGRQENEHANVKKWILLASMPNLTGLLTVEMPDAEKKPYADDVIQTALASVTQRASIPPEEQLRMLPYKLGDLAGLRLVRVIGGTLAILTDGPKDEMEAVEQPHVVVTVGVGGPEDTNSRANFSRNMIIGIPGFKDLKLTNMEVLRLSGQQVYETMADAKDSKSDAPVKLVQWVRFGASGYIHIVAVAPKDNWAEAFPRFRAVRDGIGPKEQN
jgi:hypothetical protein